MAITGYPPEDLLLKPSFIDRALERTRALLPLSRGLTVVVGTIEREIDLYNAAAVLHDGEWMGTYRKRYLPNYGVFDENRYFMPATRNPVFARGRSVIGFNICEDIWYPGGPVEEQVIRGGAEVIINISASPYHAGKAQARKRMLCTRAAELWHDEHTHGQISAATHAVPASYSIGTSPPPGRRSRNSTGTMTTAKDK